MPINFDNKVKYREVKEVYADIKRISEFKRKVETVDLYESLGRVLAEELKSKIDFPQKSFSHFDGYAINSRDTEDASPANPVIFNVKGKVFPGEEVTVKLKEKEAFYVATGAYLPENADAVIPVEKIKEIKEGVIKIYHKIKRFENVVLKGSDFRKGQTIFKAGHEVKPLDLMALAVTENFEVRVFKKVKVAFFSVGNELTDSLNRLKSGKRFSYNLTLLNLLKERKCEAVDLGIVEDELRKVEMKISEALKIGDIVIVAGGCSVGEKDYVLRAAKQFRSFKLITRGIKVQPGRMTSAAFVQGKPLIMLPGHIQSMVTGFYLIAKPLINYFSGQKLEISNNVIEALIKEEVEIKGYSPFWRVRFVELKKEKGRYVAKPLLGDSSLFTPLVKSQGFTIIPPKKTVLRKGETIKIYIY